MKDFECPHCKQPGIPYLSKIFLSPTRVISCKLCKKKVSVPWSYLWVNVPSIVFAIYVTFGVNLGWVLQMAIILIYSLVWTWIWGSRVKLIKK